MVASVARGVKALFSVGCDSLGADARGRVRICMWASRAHADDVSDPKNGWSDSDLHLPAFFVLTRGTELHQYLNFSYFFCASGGLKILSASM